jgi:hypothetical protein
MKEHMTNNINFTEAILGHWAEKQDTETLSQSLARIQAEPSSVTPELLSRLNVVGVHLELLATFTTAANQLVMVEAARPDATRVTPTELVDTPKIMGQGAAFEDSITEYLRGLHTKSTEAMTTEGKLPVVAAALANTVLQPHALRKLQKLDQMDLDEVKVPITATVEGITDNLWEVVSTGRDLAGLVRSPQSPGIDVLIADWQESIDYNFPAAQKLLDGATQWLANN